MGLFWQQGPPGTHPVGRFRTAEPLRRWILGRTTAPASA